MPYNRRRECVYSAADQLTAVTSTSPSTDAERETNVRRGGIRAGRLVIFTGVSNNRLVGVVVKFDNASKARIMHDAVTEAGRRSSVDNNVITASELPVS
jgi:hypothetical protein